MAFILVLVLIGALLLLVIGINALQQQKQRAEALRRTELTRQRAILEETEEVLANTGMFPCTSHINLALYKRIKEAAQQAMMLCNASQRADYERRVIDLDSMINNLQKSPPQQPSIENFRLPDNDRQILVLVQTLKKLKAIIRDEHNKGKMDPVVFANEENRINSLQLRINVDSMMSRARSACYMKQYGSSRQMVTKALGTLNTIKGQTPGDPFITRKVEEAKQLLEEINGAVKMAQPSAPKPKEEDDIDVLFQPKKKW
ncbi:hypothetical protein [Shewanella fodinae]|uniref:hypothetical protein n=1 Tax=Shewanella fodinae TaxID=552357 RepID=UPI00167BE0C6|nr:hypothetical protein [Shewanella fodinae]MCL2907645.1 hypothetical protein [Shewanella fodinae]GGY99699.1 hypothetical protein GCM10007169_15690 [Shewanella fodinae]